LYLPHSVFIENPDAIVQCFLWRNYSETFN
jgi:hypothetical protein